MDNQAYLDQISATTRPAKKSPSNFLSSLTFKIIIGVGIAFIIMAIIGAILSGINGNTKSNSISLKLHFDNLSKTISTYQPSLKSSTLRSYSASLSSIISSTNRDLTAYITEAYEYKDNSVDKKLLSTEAALSDELNQELFNAKINGLLDRTYARKMAYEISIITSREASLIKSLKDDTIKSSLTSSHNSLATLYDDFNNFSETK